jgi:hypothetical protein
MATCSGCGKRQEVDREHDDWTCPHCKGAIMRVTADLEPVLERSLWFRVPMGAEFARMPPWRRRLNVGAAIALGALTILGWVLRLAG